MFFFSQRFSQSLSESGRSDVWEKIAQIFQKVAKTVAKSKNVYIKVQFEGAKHLHKTTFELLKYLQQTMF